MSRNIYGSKDLLNFLAVSLCMMIFVVFLIFQKNVSDAFSTERDEYKRFIHIHIGWKFDRIHHGQWWNFDKS